MSFYSLPGQTNLNVARKFEFFLIFDFSPLLRPPTVKQEAFAKTFPAMDALITSMVQHGTLIDKAEKELQTTNNSLDAVSAKETLACLALAKHKFDDQHFSLRKRYAETTQ